ncbi:hypothetical protein Tco_1535893, partial [Tanacetum coccineum]
AEKIDEIKDDAKKAEVPPTSSSLSVFLGFGDQFLKTSSDTSLVGIVKDITDAEINSLLDIKIQYEVPHIQSPYVLTIPISVISEPSVLTPIPVTPSVAPATTLLTPSSVSTIPPIHHQTIAPIPTPPITTNALTITIDVPESNALSALQLRSHVPTVVEQYLGSKIGDDLQKVLQRHTADLIKKYSVKPALESSKIQKPTIDLEQESKKSSSEIHKIKREQVKKQKMPKYTIKSTDKATLKEYDQKSALYQTMHENKSFNRNPANHALYHALMKALIEDENVMDKGVTDTLDQTRVKRQRGEEPKSQSLPRNHPPPSKPLQVKEPVEEPITKVVMDDAGEDVVHDDDPPQDTSKPKTTKTPNPNWFKQPPRPPTLDPDGNKHQVVLGQPE